MSPVLLKIAGIFGKQLLIKLGLKLALIAVKSYVKSTETKTDDAILGIVLQLDSIYEKVKNGDMKLDGELDNIEKNVDLLMDKKNDDSGTK